MLIVQIISVVLLGISCREVYFPDDLEQSQPMLSVHGRVYEYGQPLVKLSWTFGYSEKLEKPVNNALVVVFDGSGRSDTLTELEQTGLYTIDFHGFHYYSGNEYTLRIETEDGNFFMSNPVKMPAKPVVKSFYTKHASNIEYLYTADGKIKPNTTPGVKVYTDLIGDGEDDHYYRFRTRAVEKRGYYSPPNTQYENYEYKKMNDLYDIAKSELINNQQGVLQHEGLFLPKPGGTVYKYDWVTNTSSENFHMCYIYTHRIYAISPDVYEFYESMKEQLTAENEIFAPVPSRIKSNIFCVNNDDARAIGVFEATSYTTIYLSCRYSYSYLETIPLDSPPENLPVFEIPEFPALTQ